MPPLGGANAGPLVGPIVISEIMYHPPDVFSNGAYWNDTEDEYIELRNITASPVELFDSARPTNTWKLGRAVDLIFPTNTTLAANGFALVVNFDPISEPAQLAAFRTKFGVGASIPVFGPYQGNLDNASGNVSLYRPDETALSNVVADVLVDQVQYTDQPPWPVAADGLGHALHRVNLTAYGNDPANWTSANPTPGAAIVGGTAPVLTIQPSSQMVSETGNATFSGLATGPEPLQYQWRFHGATLTDATNPVLVLSNVQLAQAGDYQLVAWNAFGAAVSRVATLTVLIPAHLIESPLSQVVTNGTNVTLSVLAATAHPPMRYQWFHDGRPIPFATNATLELDNVQEETDSGDYVAAITDTIGTVYSAPARLTILLPPSVVQPVPPVHLTVLVGQDVTLGVQTRGTRPMSYRWRRVLANNASLIVANRVLDSRTDFLPIHNVVAALDGAYYTVTLTNAAYGLPNLVFTNCFLTVLADSNSNGIPDEWESAYFGSPTGADRDGDADGDGLSNGAEYMAGTNPTNAASYLKVEEVTTGGGANVTFQAVSNRTYTVLYKDGLSEALWTPLVDVVARSTNWTATVNDPTPGTNRFYRIATPKFQ